MRTTGKATDLITFSRSSGGTALRKIAYGPELVTNGTFDTDSDWTKGTGWTISGGIASHSAPSTGNLSQTSIFVASKVYLLTYTLGGDASGGMFVYADSGNLSNQIDYETTTGEKSVIFVADGSNITFRINTAGTIDNVSVKEVLFDQGDLTLFNHPADIPRIEYDANGNVLGLLVEEARTNLLTYSEDFTDFSWDEQNATVTANAQTAPNQTLTADKLIVNNGSATTPVSSRIRTIESLSSGSVVTRTISVYGKSGEFDSVILNAFDGGNTSRFVIATFNLNTEVVTTSQANWSVDSATITDAGNGWYRCVLTYTTISLVGSFIRNQIGVTDSVATTGDGTSGIYIWGAQLEIGAFPTSYIPTSGSTATRAADVGSIATSEFGYRQDEGTVVVEYELISPTAFYSPVEINDGSTDNRYGIVADSGEKPRLISVTSSVLDVAIISSSASLADIPYKSSFCYKANDYAFAEDGTITGTDNSAIVPPVGAVSIGKTSNKYLNGHIKKLTYIPRRLTNDQLVEITS